MGIERRSKQQLLQEVQDLLLTAAEMEIAQLPPPSERAARKEARRVRKKQEADKVPKDLQLTETQIANGDDGDYECP